MTNKEFENIVIFVSDALRYGYVPESISEKGYIPTLAPSLHTPTSFASFFTGRSPENHNIRDFLDELDAEIETAFDYFENYSFWDGPDGGAIHKHVFQDVNIEDLEDMNAPFIWVERMLQTHLPYGKLNHERDQRVEVSGWNYIQKMKSGDIDALKEYQRGVDEMEKYVKSQIDYLEKEGMLEDTLVIITSDHGELLGERFLGRRRYEHNYPPLQELAQVPTVFYNYDVDAECIRLIDVVPTALSLTGKDIDLGDGVDVTEETVKEGRNIMEDPKASFDTKWVFKNGEWRPTFSSKLQIIGKTIIGDLKKSVYNYGGKQLKQKIEDKIEKESTDEVVDEIDF